MADNKMYEIITVTILAQLPNRGLSDRSVTTSSRPRGAGLRWVPPNQTGT